jgi:uncharacterized membrane protein
MRNKLFKEIILAVFPLASVVITAALYGIMPGNIPSEYSLTGAVEDYTAKSFIVFLIPLLSVFLYLYFLIVPHLDRQHDSYERFRRAYGMLRLIGGAVLLLINAAYILNVFYPGRVELVIALKVIISVGLLFIGDRLPKVKRNHFIGYVNPWTIRSEAVWQKTMRFSGGLMFITAIVMLILSFINIAWVNAVYAAFMVSLLLVPHIYSANIFYQRKKS